MHCSLFMRTGELKATRDCHSRDSGEGRTGAFPRAPGGQRLFGSEAFAPGAQGEGPASEARAPAVGASGTPLRPGSGRGCWGEVACGGELRTRCG